MFSYTGSANNNNNNNSNKWIGNQTKGLEEHTEKGNPVGVSNTTWTRQRGSQPALPILFPTFGSLCLAEKGTAWQTPQQDIWLSYFWPQTEPVTKALPSPGDGHCALLSSCSWCHGLDVVKTATLHPAKWLHCGKMTPTSIRGIAWIQLRSLWLLWAKSINKAALTAWEDHRITDLFGLEGTLNFISV